MPSRIARERRPASTIRRDLRAIFIEGTTFSLMVGAGESYLPAFVLALGMGEVASGLIVTVPLVAGGVLQLVAPTGVRLVGTARRWTVACAALQAATFLPLVLLALGGRLPHVSVFMVATLYWATGMAVGPVWNVWVERLVPAEVRTRYFARRSGAAQLGVLVGLLGAGLLLQVASEAGRPLLGFALIFLFSGASRAVSTLFLAQQTEIPLDHPATRTPSPTIRLLRHFPTGSGGRLLLYMLGLTAAVSIASPYFSAYMLRLLGLSYRAYMILVGAALAAKVVALPLLGRAVRRYGLNSVVRFAWAGIAVVPALWLLSNSYAYLVVLQVFSGVSWAAHEYATFLLLFETIRAERRTSILTAFNLGNAIVTVAGSLLGAGLFERIGVDAAGFHIVFGISSAVRAACLLLLVRVAVPAGITRHPVFRLIAVRPSTGMVLRPILATFRPRKRGFEAIENDPDSEDDEDEQHSRA